MVFYITMLHSGHITPSIFYDLCPIQDILFEQQVQELNENPIPTHVLVLDNVSFHRAAQVRERFNIHGQFMTLYLPPYSPFLNAIEEFFSSWRWTVYDRQPCTRVDLLQAMESACGDEESCQGWIHHTRGFFPRCLRRENIACDGDKVLWPDWAQRAEEAHWWHVDSFGLCPFFCSIVYCSRPAVHCGLYHVL